MTSDGSYPPLNPAQSTPPSRTCDKYKAEMTHLSDLPFMFGSTALRIFRCYVCNNVVSEER